MSLKTIALALALPLCALAGNADASGSTTTLDEVVVQRAEVRVSCENERPSIRATMCIPGSTQWSCAVS